MPEKRSIVFLYSELAGYFLSCVRVLRKQYSGEIHVIHWPVNPEAPFKFEFPEGVEFRDKNTLKDLDQYVQKASPEVIISAGWMDKAYVNICKQFKGKCPTIVTMDNHWTGDLKQRIACAVSKFVLRNKFSHIWVPGKPQKVFAEKLGFKNILLNYYCADVPRFDRYYQEYSPNKKVNMPRRFLYVGRYMAHKGIYEMWKAFIAANAQATEKWELWCLGTGDEYDQRVEADGIKHFGFVQPEDLGSYLEQTSVFILPSRFEPWGVVVHEYAVSGFPMICADAVGAATAFVKNGENGFIYEAGNTKALENCFKRVMALDDESLQAMSEKSRELGLSLTPDIWAGELLKVLN